MPMDEAKNSHVHIVVREGQKARWKDHVERFDEYGILSEFVRSAVEKQYETDITGGEVPDEIEAMRHDLLAEMEDMHSTLRLVSENPENVREQRLDEESVDDIITAHTGVLERQLDSLDFESDSEHDDDGWVPIIDDVLGPVESWEDDRGVYGKVSELDVTDLPDPMTQYLTKHVKDRHAERTWYMTLDTSNPALRA